MVPLVVVAASLGELSELAFGDAVDLPRAVELFLDMIFLFKSSLSKLFSGDTLIKELRLLEVAVCICTLPEGDVLRFTGPFRLEISYSSPGSCLMGISDMDGVILVSWSILRELD